MQQKISDNWQTQRPISGGAVLDDDQSRYQSEADDLLQRALLDDSSAVTVSMRVGGLPLSDAVTVIFHARRDLTTLESYVTWGNRSPGSNISPRELLRVPCDLALGGAKDREEAERLYIEQASALREAVIMVDTVLDVWLGVLRDATRRTVVIDHSLQLPFRLPASRLLPTALVGTEARIYVTPVCGARTLDAGRPPLGIACAQQDLVRIYPLAGDPERCLDDFGDYAAARARQLADRLEEQEASVNWFLDLEGA